MISLLQSGCSVLIAMLMFFMSCTLAEEDDEDRFFILSGENQYNLNECDGRIKLPGRLEEISGLAYWKDSLLLGVEDETGYVYVISLQREDIVKEIKFGKKGDYEGVTCFNDTALVLRSDGRLYYFHIIDEPAVVKVDLPFTEKNDLEGIATTYNLDEYLIACKRSPDIYGIDLKGRAVYRYYMRADTVMPAPYVHLTSDMFEKELERHGLRPSNHMPFMPSGIAVHPLSGDIFLISSVGKLLVVIDRSGNIIGMSPLKRSLLRQPEGICFDEHGNMFVASEGRGGKGYILRFDVRIPGQGLNTITE